MNNFTKYNFHTHTFRCQHASGTEREYIENAIEHGLEALGFADHVPCPFKEPGRVSFIRMSMEQAPEYVGTLKELAKEYAKDIDIYIGFEAEYITDFIEEQAEMCRRLDCDYLIMGQHFLTGEPGVRYTGNATRDPALLKAYVDSVLAGASTGYFMYIAHPDLVRFTGDEKIYCYEMERLCRGLKELNIPIEMNNVGMARNRHYPSPVFWKIAGEIGNETVMGLDAHSVRDMENEEAYARCLELINNNNVNYISETDRVLAYMEKSRSMLRRMEGDTW